MFDWLKRMYRKLPWVTDWSQIERLRLLMDSGVYDNDLDLVPSAPPPARQEDYADVTPFELASCVLAARSRQKRPGTIE